MDFPLVLESYRKQVEQALLHECELLKGPPHLCEAMRYALLGGGKRLRPVLLLATRALFASDTTDPLPAACAFEFVHTYSLIHDDLPCMDNDDFRRGRPSCHRQYGEALALLAGDALLTEAFRLLGDAYHSGLAGALVANLARAAGTCGMVGGQVLDTLETGRALSHEEVEALHRMKTGALLSAAVMAGAILGHATPDQLQALSRFGSQLGLAFQVTDDVLDVEGERERLGKTTGKDAAQGKTTFVSLLGLSGAKAYTASLLTDAEKALAPFGESAEPLRVLARFVGGRGY